MYMAIARGRPVKHARPMKKTSVALPDEVIESLAADAKKSGFKHWSEQLRYEVMQPRGLWKEVKPYLPSSSAPISNVGKADVGDN